MLSFSSPDPLVHSKHKQVINARQFALYSTDFERRLALAFFGISAASAPGPIMKASK
jgi:hypothetical protein